MFITDDVIHITLGVIKHKDVFTAKYVTAVITDANDRGHFVPIKTTIGDYFVTVLNNGLYVFDLKGARLITYRELLAKSVKFVEFDTCHVKAVDGAKLRELEDLLRENMLPKMNKIQLTALTILGRKETIKKAKRIQEIKTAIESQESYEQRMEKQSEIESIDDLDIPEDKGDIIFKPHDIAVLIEELADRQEEFPDEAENMMNYLKGLDIDYITTPVRKITEYLQEDLITTSPSFLGELVPRLQRLDNEHKAITNKPLTAKIPHLKLMIGLMLIFGVAAMMYIAYEEGYFDNLAANIGINTNNFANNPFATPAQKAEADRCSDSALQNRYPEPVQLKIALNEGKETCKLSPFMQELVDGTELPQVAPTQ